MRELTIPSVGTARDNSAARCIFDNARTQPEHPAVKVLSGHTWQPVTSAELAEQISSTSKGLLAAGLQPGDRLALMSKTRYEWTLIDFAALAVGIVVVPIYETSSAEQMQWILSDSGACSIVLESREHAELLQSIIETLPDLKHIWSIDDGAIEHLRAGGAGVGDDDVTARLDATQPSDIATLIYTSGTTGRPKGCVITHANLLAEVQEVSSALDHLFNIDNTTLLFLPLAHVFGRAISFGALANGTTLGHTADLNNLVTHLSGFAPTFVLGVPRVFEKFHNGARQRAESEGKGRLFRLAESTAVAYSRALDSGGPSPLLRLRHRLWDGLVYRKLRAAFGGRCVAAISGGAPLGVWLGHFFRGVGVPVFEGYGLTETTAGVCINKIGSMKIGSVGRPVGGMSLRVAEDGELQVAGPIVFARYWNDPDSTVQAITVEQNRVWFSTGDLANIDDEGFLTLTGRKKELIVTAAGKNVAPSVIEDRIRAHWLIDQCLVVGDARPYVAALITIDPEAWPIWLRKVGLPEETSLESLLTDATLLDELQGAVDDANRAVSRAEAVKRFVVLPDQWTESNGQLTASFKVRRSVVLSEKSDVIDALYAAGHPS